MKLKFFSLLAVAMLVFACSQEDAIDVPQDEQPFAIEIQSEVHNDLNSNIETGTRSPWPPFVCDPSWTPGQLRPFGYTVYEIHYSDDPLDYPGGVVDIECTRQEFFRNICGLYMSKDQPSDPYIDIWVRDMTWCHYSTKDDVNTASNNDDRVCTGPNCN